LHKEACKLRQAHAEAEASAARASDAEREWRAAAGIEDAADAAGIGAGDGGGDAARAAAAAAPQKAAAAAAPRGHALAQCSLEREALVLLRRRVPQPRGPSVVSLLHALATSPAGAAPDEAREGAAWCLARWLRALRQTRPPLRALRAPPAGAPARRI
jgi:hypothetical protein